VVGLVMAARDATVAADFARRRELIVRKMLVDGGEYE